MQPAARSRETSTDLSCSPLLLYAVLLLAACSPKFNWREVRGKDASYSVLLPAKPATFARQIDFDGIQVTMSMTAAKVDDAVFALGSAALTAMKTALVKNINCSVKSEKASAAASVKGLSASVDIEAVGSNREGKPEILYGHFVSQDNHIYQVIVMGPEKAVSRDNADTFIASFQQH